MTTGDTIAAISSSIGAAPRIIIRTSGPLSFSLAQGLGVATDHRRGRGLSPMSDCAPAWEGQAPAEPERFRSGKFGSAGASPSLSGHTQHGSHSALHCRLRFVNLTFPAWIYRFPGPRSYTGEDIIEYHVPGNPVLARSLLDELLSRGARAAEPGEFTARAFFNGRIDLTGAEGVAATIAAGSQRELAAARQLLAGELAQRLKPILEVLTDTLALVEVGIDFTEEDVSFLTLDEQRSRLSMADEALERLVNQTVRFERLSHEPEVVLIGRPNAGKSTLLNALAGRDRAVVSPTAGTTRDALTAKVTLRRGIVRVTDIAGIDSAADESEIEQQMQTHALRAAQAADLPVLVHDITDPQPPLSLDIAPGLVVHTKLDLLPAGGESRGFAVSALTGAGMDELRDRLDAACFGDTGGGASLALNLRHVRAITEARDALGRAKLAVGIAGAEVVAMELRDVIDALGSVLGRVTPDDLLGRIFSEFCIGK